MLCSVPCARHSGAERTTVTNLVLNALIEHDEGVGGCTNTDDQTCNARQVERVTKPASQQHERTVNERTGCEQGGDGKGAKQTVVGQCEQAHQNQTDNAGDQTGLKRCQAQGCRNRGGGATNFAIFTSEGQRKCTVTQVISQGDCFLGGEATVDGGSGTDRNGRAHHRGRNHLGVQGNSDLLANVLTGQLGPGGRTFVAIRGLETEGNFVLARLRVETTGDRGTCVNLGTSQSLAINTLLALQQW